jgi:hypothetical protein
MRGVVAAMGLASCGSPEVAPGVPAADGVHLPVAVLDLPTSVLVGADGVVAVDAGAPGVWVAVVAGQLATGGCGGPCPEVSPVAVLGEGAAGDDGIARVPVVWPTTPAEPAYVSAEARQSAGAAWAPPQRIAVLLPDEDPDGDGLTNAEEVAFGSRWDRADTDGDGLDDPGELRVGADPTRRDTDDDGIRDALDAFPRDPTRPEAHADDV